MTCYRKKGTVWPGKWILFRRTWIWVSWLWEELCAKLLAPGQLVGYPLKLWGITVQISCMEGRWHRNWFQSRCYFCGRPRKNQNFWQKTRCFIKRFVTFNLYKDILNPWILSPWRFQLSPFRKIFTLNFFSEKRQTNSSRTQVSEYLYNGFCGFTSVWTREWVFKQIFWLKCLFHWVHLYFSVP